MGRFFRIVTVIGAALGGLGLLLALVQDSAPKQAALAAIAVGLAVIPYCLARAVAELRSGDRTAAHRAPATATLTNVRCNQCDRIYQGHERACPYCGAHRSDSIPVELP